MLSVVILDYILDWVSSQRKVQMLKQSTTKWSQTPTARTASVDVKVEI